ncbi:hypothetical protein CP532_0470 [Ophiocordyceps camponoti-leonardi (nom. inval.)]|nr:hypothetical protein CP532_0470 [Ophiocordyceps camponoti-leonardi (nom. inval.)]
MSISRLSQLLPLPEDELRQILDYAATLSKTEAATHFQDLLGDSPLAIDFISTFNSQRDSNSNSTATNPNPKRGPGRKNKPVSASQDEDGRTRSQVASAPGSSHGSRSATPSRQNAGYLISDKARSNPPSRSSTPGINKAIKVSIAGGKSTALSDLDAAIRALEISTDPTIRGRRCNCVATRHPLQSAAPNCLSCGKVICMREGLGPCSFCGSPLLKADETQAMLRELKDERGRERMAANATANRRADVSKTPAPFTKPRDGESSVEEAAAKAREHRDRLLGFQAQNARRTTVRDEAADFDVGDALAGTGSMWASPEVRARELKRQQKLVREMEWNARPDYEKRRQVVSIDLIGNKVVRRMAAVERPATPESDEGEEQGEGEGESSKGGGDGGGGAFSRNPLLGGLMRPVFAPTTQEGGQRERNKSWRRVQDDMDET